MNHLKKIDKCIKVFSKSSSTHDLILYKDGMMIDNCTKSTPCKVKYDVSHGGDSVIEYEICNFYNTNDIVIYHEHHDCKKYHNAQKKKD